MINREKRISNIRKRIDALDNEIAILTQGTPRWYAKPIAGKVERLYDRRDLWEARLVSAEMA